MKISQADVELIRSSGLIDEEWYLETNPDAKALNIEPIEHFVRFGARLGRNPSADFDLAEYKSRFPELKNDSRKNPLLHFLRERNHGEGLNNLKKIRRYLAGADYPDPKVVDVFIDAINYTLISGWARYADAPLKAVVLDLFIDNRYYSSTRTAFNRSDVAKKFNDTGLHGFRFEITPHIADGVEHVVEVRPRKGNLRSVNNTKTLPPMPAGIAFNKKPGAKRAEYVEEGPLSGRPKLAYCVLNLNGGPLLKDFFDSFYRENQYDNYEIIIVDHGSSDESIRLCRDWQLRLNVKLIERGENASFSASNNLGAESTDAEYIVFINNDIIFSEDISNKVVGLLQKNTEIGLVGIKLLDVPLEKSQDNISTQHIGVHFHSMERLNFVHPFETRMAPHLRAVENTYFEVPSVTGAVLACRREEFLKVGGFDERYFYGYEDVDLCVAYQTLLKKKIVCANNLTAFHARGVSRANAALGERLSDNHRWMQAKFGRQLRRLMAQDRLNRPGFWHGECPRFAFAVTEASAETSAGDYFTALELARALSQEIDCQIVFLEKDRSWFDLRGVDYLIVMRDDYDLSKIQNASPQLTTIAWARNWIDRWAERSWSGSYDLVWASSDRAAAFLRKALAKPVDVVRIASNYETLAGGHIQDKLRSDYCFTGSYFGAPREIVENIKPNQTYEFKVFGHGWEKVPKMAPYSQGPVPYSSIPDVYASSRIVIDDANTATKSWGSVNSRVFDALAAGCLVITNGKVGAEETFKGLLPTYSSSQELGDQIDFYLKNEPARKALVEKLQKCVREEHSYRERAQQVVSSLKGDAQQRLRFGIKIGAPRDEVKNEWGDYHFALALKRALTRLGHSVRVDCIDKWAGTHCLGDDVVVVLRGLTAYEPKNDQINIMWNISHPHKVSLDEYGRYDHVFVASQKYAAYLSGKVSAPVSYLPQCTDPELFNPDVAVLDDQIPALFVGNSRNIYREAVKAAVQAHVPIHVYGTRWEQFLPKGALKGTYVPNESLASFYRSASVVLNDHWEDMREEGFISNRIFDVVACGGVVLTDHVEGMDEIFGDCDNVLVYKNVAEIPRLVKSITATAGATSLSSLETFHKENSFEARAREILKVIVDKKSHR